MEGKIEEILILEKENIASREALVRRNINAIVNAANPTLMGSRQGVDGAIHETVSKSLPENKTFGELICEELKTGTEKNRIRCSRGNAVVTSGGQLCEYVIHVVGAKYDGPSEGTGRFFDCSYSSVKTLESCYNEIIKQVKLHPDIRNIAIPIISSGEYGFPFELAAELAVTAIGNALIEWKTEDPEFFEMAGPEHVYLFVYNNNPEMAEKSYQSARKILIQYLPMLKEERRVVFQTSVKAHFRYLKEISLYDKKRGYFSVARGIREFLMIIRLLFLPGMVLKDRLGGRDWQKRRQFVEWFAIIKLLTPVVFYISIKCGADIRCPAICNIVFPALLVYHLSDTVTYLLVLIVMADIQRPSANIIRSMIMMFINYLEVSMDMAFLYYLHHDRNILFREAVAFGLLGVQAEEHMAAIVDYMFLIADSGIKFFFASLVFGYFAGHMRQRRFRS